MIDKLKVYGIQFATFGSGGGRYFRGGGGSLLSAGLLLSGFTGSHKKIDVNFGGSLLSELYGSLEMNHPLWTVPLSILFAFVSDVLKKCFAESNKMKSLSS